MEIKETDLPGLGKKYLLETGKGEMIVVIVHQTGRREVYCMPPQSDIPTLLLELEDEEARTIGGILGGLFFQPKQMDSMYVIMRELSIEWIKLEKRSRLIGKSIRQQEIRKRTGASIIAILRGGVGIPSPSPDEVLSENDTILIVGNREHVQKLRELL
jgi:TrkA domain protein